IEIQRLAEAPTAVGRLGGTGPFRQAPRRENRTGGQRGRDFLLRHDRLLPEFAWQLAVTTYAKRGLPAKRHFSRARATCPPSLKSWADIGATKRKYLGKRRAEA